MKVIVKASPSTQELDLIRTVNAAGMVVYTCGAVQDARISWGLGRRKGWQSVGSLTTAWRIRSGTPSPLLDLIWLP